MEGKRVVGRVKDCRDFTLEFPSPEICQAFHDLVNDNVFCGVEKRFAFSHRPAVGPVEGWSLYDESAEMDRLELLSHGFRFSECNANFGVCESYPRRVCVPASVTDQEIAASAHFRKYQRFPAVVWRHRSIYFPQFDFFQTHFRVAGILGLC